MAVGLDSDERRAHTERWEAATAKCRAKFDEHLKAAEGLSKEQQEVYRDAAHYVFERMSPEALDRWHENVKGVKFYPSTEALGHALADKGLIDSEHAEHIAGAWQHGNDDTTGTLHLDGASSHGDARGIYAHEFYHAVDGTLRQTVQHAEGGGFHFTVPKPVSGKAEWQQAWRAEIDQENAPLSSYARTNASEGFAEFGRYCTNQPRDARESFPKCFQVFVDNGLVTAPKKKSHAGAITESLIAPEHSRWVKGPWWAEEDHPRDDHGRWSSAGGVTASSGDALMKG